MRDFGKISHKIWESKKFNKLDINSKILYVYLHSNKHGNSIGCYRINPIYITGDLQIDIEVVNKSLKRTCKEHLITFDEDESIVYIDKFLKESPILSKNHAIGAIKSALSLPDCKPKILVLKELIKDNQVLKHDHLVKEIEYFLKTFERPSKDLPNTETLTLTHTLTETISGSLESDPEPKTKKKGQRIPTNWLANNDLIKFCCEKWSVDKKNVLDEQDVFIDYWKSATGAKATKLDWDATFRVWCSRSFKKHTNGYDKPKVFTADEIEEIMNENE